MRKELILRSAGSALLLIAGGLLATGGTQLLRHGAAIWPDVIASASVVSRTATGMLALGILLLVVAVAAWLNSPLARRGLPIILLVFVVGAFWAHYLLFGEFAPLRMATNIVVSAVILWLLRRSESRQETVDAIEP